MRPPVVVVHPPLVENDPGLRQAQEQLTVEQLVAKHSRANRCVISIRFRSGAVAIRVRDDGVGFPAGLPGTAGGRRHGLVGMERRVRSCGGRVRFGRPSGASFRGASVSIVVPLPLSLVGSDFGAASSIPPADRAGR
jgi:glucose-6-phosphate-specific signal transduction histidine kinase